MSSHAERLHYGVQEIINQYSEGQRANLKALNAQVVKLKKTMSKQFTQVEQALIGFTSTYVEQSVNKRLADSSEGGTSIVDLIAKYDEQSEALAASFQVTSPVIAAIGGRRKLKSIKPNDPNSCTGSYLSKVAKQRMEMLEYTHQCILGPYQRTKERLQATGRWKESEENPHGIGSKKIKPGTEVSPLEPAVTGLLKEIETLQHQLRLLREAPSMQQTHFSGSGFAPGHTTSRTRQTSPRRDRPSGDSETHPPRAATTEPTMAHDKLPELNSNYCLVGERKTKSDGPRGRTSVSSPRSHDVNPIVSVRRGFGESKALRKVVEMEKEKDRRRFHGTGAAVKTGVHRYITDEPPKTPDEPNFDEFALEVKTAMRHRVRNTKDKMQRFITQVQNEAEAQKPNARHTDESQLSSETVQMLQPTSRNTMGTLNCNDPAKTTREDQLKDHAVNRMMEKRLKRSLVGQQF